MDADANANADAGGSTTALRERCSGELRRIICKKSQKYEFDKEQGGGCDESFYLAVGNMVEVEWQQGHAQSYITCKV